MHMTFTYEELFLNRIGLTHGIILGLVSYCWRELCLS
jgi:hypothetical protein